MANFQHPLPLAKPIKPIFQNPCKSKKCKNQKNLEKTKKNNKTKKTIFQKFGDGVYRQEFWNIGFIGFVVFFGFLEVFLIFAFFRFARLL